MRSREREEVSVQLVGVRHEEAVRGVLIDAQRAVSHQLRGLAPTELQRRLKVVVAVNDQRRNADRLKLITKIGHEAGLKELRRRPCRAVQALPNDVVGELR